MKPFHVLFPLLAVLAAAHADAERDPEALRALERAVAAQGAVAGANIRDVTLVFDGEVNEDGRHALIRRYWYRAADRSFRVSTRSKATSKDKTAERGVFGAAGFWDRDKKGRIVPMRRGNREHRKLIRSIENERKDFESILEMVRLERLLGPDASVTSGAKAPVTIPDDQPYGASGILGRDRAKATYRVVDVTRPGEARLRLFVRTDDDTVRKVVQYSAEEPDQPVWFYYFGDFQRDPQLGLHPRYFALHAGRPTDKDSKLETLKAQGKLTVTINAGLADTDLRPAAE